jgi:hypothetical protein
MTERAKQQLSSDNEYYKRLLNLKDSPGGKKTHGDNRPRRLLTCCAQE